MSGEVRLRGVVDADRDLIRAIEDEPAGNAMAQVFARTDAQLAVHWDRVLNDPAVLTFVIEYEQAGDWCSVGFVTSFVTPVPLASDRDQGDARRRCIGYRIGQAWWGRGIATRALRLFLEDSMFERPLWAIVAATNDASLRVLSKCGFDVVARRWSAGSERYPAGNEVVFRLG